MSTFILKIIALVTMIIDHTGNLLNYNRVLPLPQSVGFYFRCIGRIAFPIYAFLIAEGCKHTRNIRKYLMRLLAFALISEIPFDYCIANTGRFYDERVIFIEFSNQNVFFTLFLGVLSIYIYQMAVEKLELDALKGFILSVIPAVFIGLIANRLHTDYGLKGVLMIYFTYVSQEVLTFIKPARLRRILAPLAFLFLLYPPFAYIEYTYMFFFACISLLFIFLYNGKKGPGLKWMFYIVYPMHLLILGALWFSFFKVPIVM